MIRGSLTTGTFTSDECEACDVGKYSDSEATFCIRCKVGAAAPDEGSAGCVECGAGKYANSASRTRLGSTRCVACEPGKSNDEPKQSSCTPCKQGKYNAEQGQESCIDCPAGTSTGRFKATLRGDGATECSFCKGGKFSIEGNRKDVGAVNVYVGCEDCKKGRYAPGPVPPENIGAQDQCIQCELGYYQDTEGSNRCAACPYGKTSNTEVLHADVVFVRANEKCDDCAAGEYERI